MAQVSLLIQDDISLQRSAFWAYWATNLHSYLLGNLLPTLCIYMGMMLGRYQWIGLDSSRLLIGRTKDSGDALARPRIPGYRLQATSPFPTPSFVYSSTSPELIFLLLVQLPLFANRYRYPIAHKVSSSLSSQLDTVLLHILSSLRSWTRFDCIWLFSVCFCLTQTSSHYNCLVKPA